MKVMLGGMSLESIKDRVATMVVKNPSVERFASDESRQNQLAELLRSALGGGPPVRVRFRREGGEPATEQAPDVSGSAQDEAMRNPTVRAAMELFDAKLVAVRKIDDQAGTEGSKE